jgi:lipopolysaccharide heptosyltransferase I
VISKRLLVLRLSSFGDILHTLPAVALLRALAPPPVQIGWVVNEKWREVVELVAPVDRVIVFRGPGHLSELRRSAREFGSGETTIDFQGLIKSAMVGAMAGAKRRYGFSSGTVRERASLLFTNRRVDADPAQHVVEQNLSLARAVGGGVAAEPAPLDFSRFEQPVPAAALDSKTLLINPGAAHSSKRWDPARFRQVALAVRESHQMRPMVIWGPGEEGIAAEIARDGAADLAPPTNLRQLAWMLRRAGLLLSGDTGPLHLAAAMGTKVVALFGPTSPARNGPYGQPANVVQSWTGDRRMESIEVERVVRKIGEVL